MAVNGELLAALVMSKMDQKFKTVRQYNGPLAQQNPAFFIEYCQAIGKGIIQGNPVINFATVDTGVRGTPLVAGAGMGLGVIVDTNAFTKLLYTEIRNQSIATYGKTAHPAWCDEWAKKDDPTPPPAGHCSLENNQYNPYNFLTATCEAISEAVSEHYAQLRVLTSANPQVYMGTAVVPKGGFFGANPVAVGSAIQGLGPSMVGSFWPILCMAIGTAYSRAIMEESTGELVISGACIPNQSQTCGVPGSGTGTGTAL